MINPLGFVIVDKPPGLTSHDCVNRLRKAIGIKRVGHGGTLDPSVTGVLPIAIGSATRLLTYLPGEKSYEGMIQLGKQTNTDDLDGEILSDNHWPKLDKQVIQTCLENFQGQIKQSPPIFSSVHIQGERA